MGREEAAAGADCLAGEGCEPTIIDQLLASYESPKDNVENLSRKRSTGCQTDAILVLGIG